MEIVILLGLALTFVIGGALWIQRHSPLYRAEALAGVGKLDEALGEYEKALEKTPRDVNLHFRVATIHMGRSEWAEAAAHFDRALAAGGRAQSAQREQLTRDLAVCRFQLGEYESAFRLLRALEAEGLGDATGTYYLGAICLYMDAVPEARVYLERAYRGLRGFFDLTFALGVAYAREGDGEGALRCFQEARGLRPLDQRLPLMAGVAAYLAGQPATMRQFLQVALDDARSAPPVRAVAFRVLALQLVQEGKLAEARDALEDLAVYAQTNRLGAEHGRAALDLGYVNVALGEPRAALEAWRRLDPDAPVVPELPRLVALAEAEVAAADAAAEAAAARAARGGKGGPRSHEPVRPDYLVAEDGGDGPYLVDLLDAWRRRAVTGDLAWELSGLAPARRFEIRPLLDAAAAAAVSSGPAAGFPGLPGSPVAARAGTARPAAQAAGTPAAAAGNGAAGNALVDAFLVTDRENFEILVRRMLGRLGYRVAQSLRRTDLGDFGENEGLDYVVVPEGVPGEKTLFQARKWRTGRMGDLHLKNLLGRMQELKCTKALFLTTAEFSPAALVFGTTHPDLRLIAGDQLRELLSSVV